MIYYYFFPEKNKIGTIQKIKDGNNLIYLRSPEGKKVNMASLDLKDANYHVLFQFVRIALFMKSIFVIFSSKLYLSIFHQHSGFLFGWFLH